jgi:hypothetical protein
MFTYERWLFLWDFFDFYYRVFLLYKFISIKLLYFYNFILALHPGLEIYGLEGFLFLFAWFALFIQSVFFFSGLLIFVLDFLNYF